MPIPRRAKRDANEAEIIRTLRAVGALVESLSIPNVPDLLVQYRGRLYLMEVKTTTGKLRPGQVEFQQIWQSSVVRSAEDALKAIGAME